MNAEQPYRIKKIYEWQETYWPVLVRPGRQRKTRVGFSTWEDALSYGGKVMDRYEQLMASLFGEGLSDVYEMAQMYRVEFGADERYEIVMDYLYNHRRNDG